MAYYFSVGVSTVIWKALDEYNIFFLSDFIRHLFYIASIFIVIVVQIIIVDDELKYYY